MKTRSITYIGMTGIFDARIVYFGWLFLASKIFFNKMLTMKLYYKEVIMGKSRKLTTLILVDASQDF